MEQGFVVTIPTTMDPFVVDVNGKIYSFPAGTEQLVNQEVYEVIQNIQAQEPKPVAPSGGGTYPDWNASDGEPGHILNRPFYEEPRVLFDQTIDFAQENPQAGTYIVNEAWPINAGDTVVVTWDGVRYECVATTHQFGVVFGDVGGMFGGESTGEPFAGIVESSQGTSVIMAKDRAVHSVKVEAMEIKTLDPKFIPAGVGGGGVVEIPITWNDEQDDFTVGKTFAEMREAIDSGSAVVLKDDIGGVYYLQNDEGGYLVFMGFYTAKSGTMVAKTFIFDSDGYESYYSEKIDTTQLDEIIHSGGGK